MKARALVASAILPGLISFSANGATGPSAYQRLYDAGVRAIRIDLNWAAVETSRGHYDFAALDREIAPIRAAHLRIIGILDYGNPLYSTAGALLAQTPLSQGLPPFAIGDAYFWPPDDVGAFARYAHAAAAHFSADAVGFEVWNEENEGWRFWPPHEDPGAYARLLCAAYPALKSAAPTVPVLFGGVFFPAVADLPGESGPDFLGAAYAANPGLGQCFDVMAYHPYPYPFTAPELDVPVRGSVLAAADAMRSVLAAHGDVSKPLWITEIGWPTNDQTYGVPEAKQAQYVARMMAATFAEGVPVLSWYTYGDFDDPTGGADQEAHFGFFHTDGSPKPAFAALRTFTATFAGATFVADRSQALGLPAGAQDFGGRGFALEYQSPAATITALWLADESALEAQGSLPAGGTLTPPTRAASLPVHAPSVTVVDYLGQTRTLRARGGHVALDLGPGPQYVIDPRPPATQTHACTSRRVITIHSRRRVEAAYVNGRRIRSTTRHRVRVDLRGLPRERVRVVVRVKGGAFTRSYRTCESQLRR